MTSHYELERLTPQEMKDHLGWFDGNEQERADLAFAACMALCEKLTRMERTIALLMPEPKATAGVTEGR